MSLYLGSSWPGDLLGAFDWLNSRGQPVGAKREPPRSRLPKDVVVLARPLGLHIGETPPWRADINKNQKKRIAIFCFGAISNFLARDYREHGERKRFLWNKCSQRWQIPLNAPGSRAPPSWDGSGPTRAAASFPLP
ncbi:hypothetical protein DFAR_1650003 [Desulfarculales bacterium]